MTLSLLQNLVPFTKAKIAIRVQKTDEKKEKKVAPPLPAEALRPNITHPLASAKSAIDQRAKNKKTTVDRTYMMQRL
jgi:hypothetical protein